MSAPTPTSAALREALRGVVDPELGDNLVDLGMVGDVAVSPEGAAIVEIALTVAGCPLRHQIRSDVETRVSCIQGVTSVEVRVGTMDAAQRQVVMARARRKASERAGSDAIPPGTRVLAIASGKGGVGKSSVSVNLACALAATGLTVGLLDADIWGFSVPRMLGLQGRLEPEGTPESWVILPQERRIGDGLLQVVSMGLLAEREDEAIMWRGLILTRALQHFVEDVRWGSLDYLLVDMPPGTGDIQMGLARLLPRAEVVIVTTPHLAAARVASRVADMARKGYLRVAGVVENMTSFTCDHGAAYQLFGSGGGAELAREIGVPLLAELPFDPAVAEAGDTGRPPALHGEGRLAAAFTALAGRLAAGAAPALEMSGCTARLLRQVEEAVGG
ncbi:MAG: Mrp/NBP35 family ATP-binding protein [Acidimicrobiales bacterium]